mmetsp:Transcript_34672/g.91868  ORF Transcript_34672/g.91868 Transcript_34672/m.91868 type:complete len:248 (+) Transcript_34672:272-1015(+)
MLHTKPIAESFRSDSVSRVRIPTSSPRHDAKPPEPMSTDTSRISPGQKWDGGRPVEAGPLIRARVGVWPRPGRPAGPARPSALCTLPAGRIVACQLPGTRLMESYSTPMRTSTPRSRATLRSSFCRSLMEMTRRSGFAPKSLGGGSISLAPRPFRSSPHQLQMCSWLMREKSWRCSISTTCAPSRRSSMAARRPQGPAPITTQRRPRSRPLPQAASAYSGREALSSRSFHSFLAFQLVPPSSWPIAW